MPRHLMRSYVERVVRPLGGSPAAPAATFALAIILYWSARDGAADPLVSVPGSLMLIGLLVVVAWAAPGSIPGGRAGYVALLAFATYVIWCFLSILWAGVPARAWSGANVTLVYFVIYTLFAIRPWRPAAAAAFLGAYSVGIAAIGVWVLLRLDDADRRTASFIGGRLIEPISYANANCALYAGAVIPALFLASRKETPTALRGLFLGAAGVLVQMAILCQSRMSLFAFPLIVFGYLVLVPNRLRSLLALLFVGIVVATSMSPVLGVFEAVTSGQAVFAAIVDAQHAILTRSVALGFVGIAWGLVDRKLELSSRALRVVVAAFVGIAVCGGIASIALFAERYGNPIGQTAFWWDKFRADDYVTSPGTPHLVSGFGGAGRYDNWAVALNVFERHPILGIGVDNFGVDWLRERPNDQDVVTPHSVQLRVLQQTGLVGAALLSAFLGAAVVAGWGALRRGADAARGTAASALLVFAYWGVHGSVDWLWEIPALSAAAFAALGLVVALSPVRQSVVRRPWIVQAPLSVLAVAALVTLVPPWLSAREVEVALDAARESSGAAYVHLDRARALNPLSDEPDVLGSVIAAGRGDTERQRVLLLRAISRNPDNWYPYVELGVLDASRSGRKAALRWLAKARALNPRDATIRFVVERVRAGRPPTRAELDDQFVKSADACCRP